MTRRILDSESGFKPVEGRGLGLLKESEDDGSVGDDERLARFRFTSTLKRAASVMTVARSMTVREYP